MSCPNGYFDIFTELYDTIWSVKLWVPKTKNKYLMTLWLYCSITVYIYKKKWKTVIIKNDCEFVE